MAPANYPRGDSRTVTPAPVGAVRLRFCSDEQLVDRFRGGCQQAFGVIHDRYRARLLAYVRSMLTGRSREDVEDVFQDVLLRAATALRESRAPIGLRAWLYSVAHNRCIDELRRRPPESPDVLAASRAPSSDTTVIAERRDDVARLFRDLRALPELQRSALLMRELQGLSHLELALALEVTVPAVKSLLVRARTGLVGAQEARDAPCQRIRDDLAGAHDRRVKATAEAARHLRECSACSTYRAELRRTSRRLGALLPGPMFLPLTLLGRLFGRAGVHAKAPVLATGISGSGGGSLLATGTVVALLGAAATVTTGAVLDRHGALRLSPGPPAVDRSHALHVARAGSRVAVGQVRTQARAPARPPHLAAPVQARPGRSPAPGVPRAVAGPVAPERAPTVTSPSPSRSSGSGNPSARTPGASGAGDPGPTSAAATETRPPGVVANPVSAVLAPLTGAPVAPSAASAATGVVSGAADVVSGATGAVSRLLGGVPLPPPPASQGGPGGP